MAAGLGFKTFNTGDVLSAADVNGYLMQGVWVFANATARTSAVTSPQEGNVSFLRDTNSLEIYDGAAWVAYGAGDITGVTAGTGISGGGTSGSVTITNSMATAIDAKGDLIVGTGADTFDRLAVGGTNGQLLTVDSSTATGLRWATPAASTSGLTYITGATISNSGTTSINNCFTSTYDHYRIMINLESHTNTNFSQLMRLRASSTDTTTNYESLTFERTWSGGAFATTNTTAFGTDVLFLGFMSASSAPLATVIDVMNPQRSRPTQLAGSAMGSGQGNTIFGRHTGNNSFDGFTIFTSSGSWTSGNVRVYGYQNS